MIGEQFSHTQQKHKLFSVSLRKKWHSDVTCVVLASQRDALSLTVIIFTRELFAMSQTCDYCCPARLSHSGEFRCWITRLCKFRRFAKTSLSHSQVRRALPMHVWRLRPGDASAGPRRGVRARLQRLPAGGSVLRPWGPVLRNHRRVPNAAQPRCRRSRSVSTLIHSCFYFLAWPV